MFVFLIFINMFFIPCFLASIKQRYELMNNNSMLIRQHIYEIITLSALCFSTIKPCRKGSINTSVSRLKDLIIIFIFKQNQTFFI